MIPEEFIARMRDLIGEEELSAYLAALSAPQQKGIRINRVKSGTDRTLPFSGLEPIPWEPDGYYIGAEEKAGAHPLHAAGAYYMQEPSAMTVVAALGVGAEERVLDLCAAPGGKTTHAASEMRDGGLIVANEIHAGRAAVLAENVRRTGLTHTIVTSAHPAVLAQKFPEFFDAAIVDAPCSGEGMFKKSDNAVTGWSLENVRASAARQAAILDSAASCVRPGGRIVYSTCTFSREENEDNVEAFLARNSRFCLSEVRLPGVSKGLPGVCADTTKCARVFPHRARGEGHFVALLARSEETPGSRGSQNARVKPFRAVCDRKSAELYRAFCRENGVVPTAMPLSLWGDRLFGIPDGAPDLEGIKTLIPGQELGRIKKDRFEPAHGYAVSLKPSQCRTVALTNGEAKRYVRGETFEAIEKKGWYVVTVDGYTLGWVKCADGVAKNRYDKSLRDERAGRL